MNMKKDLVYHNVYKKQKTKTKLKQIYALMPEILHKSF